MESQNEIYTVFLNMYSNDFSCLPTGLDYALQDIWYSENKMEKSKKNNCTEKKYKSNEFQIVRIVLIK